MKNMKRIKKPHFVSEARILRQYDVVLKPARSFSLWEMMRQRYTIFESYTRVFKTFWAITIINKSTLIW